MKKMSTDETILTRRQMDVLKLRNEGYSQDEITKRWGTTEQNISTLEKMAWRSVKRAENRAEIRMAYDGLSLATEIHEELMDKIRHRLAAFHTKNDSLFRLCWDRNAHIFPPRHCNRHPTVIRDLQL
jgi:transcriptional regulator